MESIRRRSLPPGRFSCRNTSLLCARSASHGLCFENVIPHETHGAVRAYEWLARRHTYFWVVLRRKWGKAKPTPYLVPVSQRDAYCLIVAWRVTMGNLGTELLHHFRMHPCCGAVSVVNVEPDFSYSTEALVPPSRKCAVILPRLW